jgi:hypothetical protein
LQSNLLNANRAEFAKELARNVRSAPKARQAEKEKAIYGARRFVGEEIAHGWLITGLT